MSGPLSEAGAVSMRPAGLAVTEGTLLGGRVRYAQPARGFRSGIEPVLLAACVPARDGERVLEAGSGAGAGLLCLAARVPGVIGIGVEQDPALVSLAAANAAANGFHRLAFHAGDVLSGIAGDGFDHAMANPPYHHPGGTTSGDPAREAAKRAPPGGIGAWATALARRLRPGGSLSLILSAPGVPEAMGALVLARIGSLVLLPLWPRAGRAARLVLLRGIRGGRGAFVQHPGLVLHDADGRFNDAAEAVLRAGDALG
ncbi:MAG: tRNA1(Val) (adenine(37)-N6)-methyltransferase [Acetobacteraceae bacterium]